MNRHLNFGIDRRRMLQTMAATSAGLLLPKAYFDTPGRFAEELQLTPSMTEGPFYPDRLPLDTDNDLLVITDSITPAVGEITHLTGRVLSQAGEPIRGALVEIWQVDNQGSYIHSRGGNPNNGGKRDANFQGYGRFLTDQKGQYYFRTIKPVPYPGRTPHIHYSITIGNRKVLSTQMLIAGNEANERDGLLRAIQDPELRKLLLAEFKPVENSKIGEQQASFDLVVGYTPEDND